MSTVFIARSHGTPRAGGDAGELRRTPLTDLPCPLAFDHERILSDYRRSRKGAPPGWDRP